MLSIKSRADPSVAAANKFLALDNVLINNDGSWIRPSDYRLYRNESGRFHLLPHPLLAVPAWRQRYLGYVRHFAETWLGWTRLGPLAERPTNPTRPPDRPRNSTE